MLSNSRQKQKILSLVLGKDAYDMLFKWLLKRDSLDGIDIARDLDLSNVFILCDMDGVLTDSTSSYSKDGKVLKEYGAYDTEMMTICSSLGATFTFFTSDRSGADIHKARWEQCLKSFGEICTPSDGDSTWRHRLSIAEDLKNNGKLVAYVGDSISDLNLKASVEWLFTTANAPDVVKHYADYASPLEGGHGGLADCLTKLLELVAQRHSLL